jgi:hypothetical protein
VFIRGMSLTVALLAREERLKLGLPAKPLCVPWAFSTQQAHSFAQEVRDKFIEWARVNPDRLNERYWDVLMSILERDYACP